MGTMIKVERKRDKWRKEWGILEAYSLGEEHQHTQQSHESFQSKSRIHRQYDPDDTNITKLFLAIREHKLDKIKEITELLDLIGNINDVDLNDNNNTPLHVAVSKGHTDVVELLINKGARIDVVNNENKTPLDVAQLRNRQNIVQVLKSQQGTGGHSSLVDYSQPGPSHAGRLVPRQHGTAADEVNYRLKKFVEYFVNEFEAKLHAYHMVLEGEVKKAGKFNATFSKKIGKVIGGVIGGGFGLLLASFTAVGTAAVGGAATGGATLGEEAFGSLGDYLGAGHHRKKVITLSDLVYYSKKNKADVRRILVEAGFDIFQSFEMQLMRVTIEERPEGALRKFAVDATNRILSYYMNEKNALITEGVIFGESKIEPELGVPIFTSKVKTPGYEVNYKYESSVHKWYTASLYEKAGLVKEGKEPSHSFSYYDKLVDKSRTNKYGYRRLFTYEEWTTLRKQYKQISKTSIRSEFTDYQYILDPKSLNDKVEYLLHNINLDDKSFMEKRMNKMLREVKDDIIKGINDLKKLGYEQDRQILANIETNLKNLKEDGYVKLFEKYFNEGKKQHQKIVSSINENKEENRENFQAASKERQEIRDKVDLLPRMNQDIQALLHKTPTNDKKPVWFEIRESVKSFTALTPGRQEQLEKIGISIQDNIVVISGFPGIGKSELAIRYARSQYTREDSVIWINAETSETTKKSFHSLAKDKLNIRIKDEDEEERNNKSVLEDVYQYLAKERFLIIFDNAEKYSAIEKFLPIDLPNNAKKPHILVTSPNTLEWKSTRINIETLTLSDFTDAEAIEFIKKSLASIFNSDNFQNDTKKLAQKLHNFPLALQLAVTNIRDTNEEFRKRDTKFKIGNYLEKYETDKRRLLSITLPDDANIETIFKILEITVNKIKEDKEHGQLALDMLNIISYFAPSNIPEKIFLNESAGDNLEKLIPVTSILLKYSIVRLKQGLLDIHGLVQQVIRLELEEQLVHGICLEEKTLDKALEYLKKHMANRSDIQRYVPHIISAWSNANKYDSLIENFIVKDIVDSLPHISYFHLIVESGDFKMVDTILSKVEDEQKISVIVNAVDEDKKTPLHYAVQGGNTEIVRLLISIKANVNTRDRIHNVPLHIAAKHGHLGIVSELIKEKNIDINAETSSQYII